MVFFPIKVPGKTGVSCAIHFVRQIQKQFLFFFRLEKADFNENTTGTKSSFQKRSFVTGTCSATEIRF